MADYGFTALVSGVQTYILPTNTTDSLSLGEVLKLADGLTNTAGEILLSGGNLQLNDSISLSLGTGDDDSISHDGTDTLWTHATGDLTIDNTLATGSTIMRLGTDTSATSFEVHNDSASALFTIGGAGLATFAGDLDVNGTGVSNFAGAVTIEGSLTVNGTTTTVDSETVLMADNHIYQNAGYTTAVAQTGGLVVNYLPTATATTTAGSGVFVAGVDTTSDPTVTTAGAATFAASDLVEITGAADSQNNGLFEVVSHAANVLTIRSTANGVTDQVEDFTNDQFTANAGDTGATLTKVTVSVLRSGTDGAWETGSGSATPISFSDLASASGVTLQTAYDTGASITTASSTDIDFVLTSGDFHVAGAGTFNLDSAMDTSGAVTNSAGEHLFSGGNLQLNDSIVLSLGTGDDDSLSHDGTDTLWTHTTGDLTFDNTLATGSTIMQLGTDTSATDFQVQNDTGTALFTVDGSSQATVAGNLDVTSGVDVSGADITLAAGLGLHGAGALDFQDGNYAASGFDTDFVLSDSSTEWDDVETAFGEVSLLAMLVLASQGGFVETADEAILALELVAADDAAAGSGNIRGADHNGVTVLSRAIGIASAAASADAAVTIITSGKVTIPAGQWDGDAVPADTFIGFPIFGSVTIAGEYTSTAPTASGDTAQVIGTYLGSGKIAVNIAEPVEIA
jgi:hypothetical protein